MNEIYANPRDSPRKSQIQCITYTNVNEYICIYYQLKHRYTVNSLDVKRMYQLER